jgi:hypothetical protein
VRAAILFSTQSGRGTYEVLRFNTAELSKQDRMESARKEPRRLTGEKEKG